MKASLLLSLLPIAQGAVIDTRQSKTGDGKQGEGDATQADLSQRPPPRFPFPITKFPVAKETVVLKNAKYILPGEVFDGKMKRYERPEGSCNEQAEGTDADTVFNLMPGATIRNVIIGKHQAEGIHALGDAWVENGMSDIEGFRGRVSILMGLKFGGKMFAKMPSHPRASTHN
jgi:hypothetical protein